MSKPTICTIIAKNYLAAARCLTESFLEHHPDGQVFVLLIDDIEGYFDPAEERFITVRINDIGVKNVAVMLHRYTIVELSTAVKPFFLERLFREYECDKICYFDPDIYFYQPIDEIWVLLEQYGLVLTPHLLDFLDNDYQPSELNILQSGTYNLGFIGLSTHAELDRFLRWWQERLTQYCVVDIDRGLFVDQKWVDLALGYFSSIYIHRDPGCNVAYWNLNHRQIEAQADGYLINGAPLKFFHFSGYAPDRPEVLSKHQNRFTFEDLPEIKLLFEAYGDCLLNHDYMTTKTWAYSYDQSYELDIKIPNPAKTLWREWEFSHPALSSLDTEAYERFMVDFMIWLNEPVEPVSPEKPTLTRLALAVHQQRRDLQKLYPDVLGAHRQAYIRWFLTWAKTEYNLDDLFLQPLQSSPSGPKTTLHRLAARAYPLTVDLLFKVGVGSWLERNLDQNFIGKVRHLFGTPTPVGAPTGVGAPVPASQTSTSNGRRPQTATLLAPPRFNTAVLGLNIVGYMHDETGIGEAARASVKALHQHDFPVAYTTVHSRTYRQNDRSIAHLTEGHPYDYNCFYVNADQANVVYNELGPQFFKGKYNIGYWHWELEYFPVEWLDRFQHLDEVWVGSNFVQNSVAQASPAPVVKIGNHVEKRPSTHITRRHLQLPPDKFIFLFVFDMYSFFERKNPLGVIEAYRRAFGRQGADTHLALKVTNLDKFPKYQDLLKEGVASVGGTLIDNYLDREVLNGLFHVSDAYVSLHRSEGFGLTLAEAMYLGKPVIATAYSANVDFMNVTNSYPVGYNLVELDLDYGPYKRGQVWAEPDLDHAAAQMRRVVADPEEVVRIGARAMADIDRLYGQQAVAQKIINRLRTISGQGELI